MFVKLKENTALLFDGLFGKSYGIFDLMEDYGTFPSADAEIIALPIAPAKSVEPANDDADIQRAA